MDKPIVKYKKVIGPLFVGQKALVRREQAESPQGRNTTWAATSPVVGIGPEVGVFETQDTIYIQED